MKPIKYTLKENEEIVYHYTFKQLRDFLAHGFKEGNNGVILVGQDKRFLKYRGFGTIENPWKYLATISMENDPMFDGEMPIPENVVNPIKSEEPFAAYKFVIWDASESLTKK